VREESPGEMAVVFRRVGEQIFDLGFMLLG
jgi:hypothetical protein